MARENMGDALRLAQQGFRIIPLYTVVDGSCDCGKVPCPNKPGKHPRITAWEKRASDKLADVLRWWKEWPWANIGVVCGASGAVVVDVDPRNGGIETVDGWVAEHGELPAGPKAITGSGGFHYYFAHPAGAGMRGRSDHGFIGNRTAMRPGIDIKADGGQVVAPPSVYETGVMYRWADGCGPELDLPVLPHWLREMILEERVQSEIAAPAYALLERIPVGQRHQELVRWAGFMRQKGASESIIFASLMAVANERAVQSATDPLLPEEIAALAADAVRRWEPGEAFVYTTQKPEAPRDKRTPQPFTAPELIALELPDPDSAVPDLLPEGLAVLAGKPKIGKSFMSFNIGLAVAAGGIVMGDIPVEEGEVLILALEDNKRRLKKRLLQMLMGEEAPYRLHLETEWPREDEGGLSMLEAWLGQHPETKLVVIDTLARFRQLGGNGKYQDDYASIAGLQTLAGQHGICILLITHFRKAISEDGDWVDNITGTLGIAGAADTLLGLTRARNGHDAILHVTGRDVEQRDLALKWDGVIAQWRIEGTAEEYQMGQETGKLLAILGEIGGPVKVNDIAAQMEKKRGATARLCQRAAREGLIRSYGNGMYGQKEAAT